MEPADLMQAPITEAEIGPTVRRLPNHSAPGPDQVTCRVQQWRYRRTFTTRPLRPSPLTLSRGQGELPTEPNPVQPGDGGTHQDSGGGGGGSQRQGTRWLTQPSSPWLMRITSASLTSTPVKMQGDTWTGSTRQAPWAVLTFPSRKCAILSIRRSLSTRRHPLTRSSRSITIAESVFGTAGAKVNLHSDENCHTDRPSLQMDGREGPGQDRRMCSSPSSQ